VNVLSENLLLRESSESRNFEAAPLGPTGGRYYPRRRMTRSADAIVIGAGVIGSAVAFELARAGKRVIVVDRLSGPGSGSTSW